MNLGNTSLAFRFHPLAIATAISLAAAYPLALALVLRHREVRIASKNTSKEKLPLRFILKYATGHQIASFYTGIALALIAVGWPLGDLARKYSLLAYLLSNSMLMLGTIPLILLAFPKWFYAEITRGKFIDGFARQTTRPIPSTIIFTTAVIFSMAPSVVEAQSSSQVIWDLYHLVLVCSAAIMWLTALNLLPGLQGLSSLGRVAFLFAQSLLPTFPALVLVFARHSMYRPFMFEAPRIGLTSLADQQLAGGVVKLIAIVVFWSVAATILARASRDEEHGIDLDQITWDDIERELNRSSPMQESEQET